MRTMVSVVAALAVAGSAYGQCTIRRLNVPDFDQKRDALPGDGGMYCVPTASVNWMAYIANHGWPTMMLQSGPVNWQVQSRFDFVTDQIDLMGDLMNTSASDGTSGGNGSNGLFAFMFSRSFGHFTVTRYSGEISPNFLYFQMLTGGLVSVCYGYYKPVPGFPGRFFRDGGHCVTLNAVYNACTNSPTIRYRDPSSDGALASQSTFASFNSGAVRQTFANAAGSSRSRWRLTALGVGSTTRRYLDSAYVITPLIALTASATRTNEVVTLRPVRFDDGDLPAESAAPVPNGTNVTGLALHPAGFAALVSTRNTAPLGTHYIYRYNVANEQFQQLFTCLSSFQPVFNRFGEAYSLCNGDIRRFTLPEAGGFELINEVSPATPFQMLACDDTRDEIVALSRSEHRLGRFIRTLDGVIDQPLPTAVPPLTGDLSLAIDEANQHYYIAGSDRPTIYQLGLVPSTNRLQLLSQFTLPNVPNPRGVQLNDLGHLMVLGDGSVREFARSAIAGWLPVLNSPFAGMEGNRALIVARSRTDFQPGIDDTTEWRDVPSIDLANDERPDCTADWNADGVVNSNDISAYLSAWLRSVQGGTPTADFNGDGAVNSNDISAFISAWLSDLALGCW